MARRVELARVKPGQRFRFPEEPRLRGYPYTVLGVSVTVKGSSFFADGERPIALRRRDGRYPRYGRVQGFFPVRDSQGRLVHWVAHPTTEVLVPSFFTLVGGGLLVLIVLLAALAALGAGLSNLRFFG